jgi:hypothetical protein
MTALTRFAAALLAALFFSSAAAAQSAPRVFTVQDLAVDETAESAPAAQQKAWAAARVEAARRLVEKLTLPEDRAAANPAIDNAALGRLVTSTDIQVTEKRTANRYIATLIMRFNPGEVRQYLETRGVPFVEAPAAKALIVPVVSGRLDPVAWGQAWAGKADDTRLTPYVASQETWDRQPQWGDLEGEVAARQAARAVVAEAYQQDGATYVRLTEQRSGVPATVLAVAGPYQNFQQAQAGAIAALETEWKKATVVRTSGSTSAEVIARFDDLRQWVRIRRGLEQSRMVRDLKIESLSTSGADLSFVYAGRPDQLAADLRTRGLELSSADGGWVVRPALGQ